MSKNDDNKTLRRLGLFSLIKAIFHGEVNRREIILSVGTLVAIRLIIYLAMHYHLV